MFVFIEYKARVHLISCMLLLNRLFISLSHSMAKKGVVVYTVGCEPQISNGPLTPSLMRAMADITGGQYVPLADAALLSAVVIGSCREELSLDRVSDQVCVCIN